MVYIENTGGFIMPYAAIKGAHAQKVVLDQNRLTIDVQNAILSSHVAEQPN